MSEQKQWLYKVEDIFEDIPDDPKNVNMNIPKEISDEIGLVPGDPIKISWGDQGSIIIEKIEEGSSGEK
jgi:hypothetical protein